MIPQPGYDLKVISIQINGEAEQYEAPLTVGDLMQRKNLTGKRVAVERNGEIVPRSRFDAQPLTDGDKLEIVVAVGGG
ncbi:MAG: sulfur carrier protein ThiS [Pseudomonadota bacterium]